MRPAFLKGRDKPLNEAAAALPDVGEAVAAMLYPIIFEKMRTTLVNGYATNDPIRIFTRASIQPFTAQMLKVKPEGQRSWSWFTIHSLTDLNLENSDRIKAQGKKYKIMEKLDWSRNGYYEYHAILDYQEKRR